ncbi:DUF2332 domain-containing protein [Aliiroseovarius sp. S2029]|uniref:DUF2332 domain-containing protein n=1 Tax=Aliiroseovarius sp. S2029 TaxID=2936988 RepID=UPI0020C0363F|nr:DUF2332 domain-containing protein [Aliiroseovarius sp. S2029]MCK8483566.1 DUF2332 domain-containing protein [Aliiroseovarius sp. S2029]
MSLRDALRHQAGSNRQLGSPFTARVLDLLAENIQPGTSLTDRMFDWPGDIGPRGHSVPLRLLAGLHALVLTGACPALQAVYPPNPAPDDSRLWAAIQAALTDHAALLNQWLDNPPQTNEVRRAAVLIAAGHWLAAQYDLPIRMYELGASAGLNLMWDRFALALPGGQIGPPEPVITLTPDWRGDLPTGKVPTILSRRGVDLMPMNARDPEDALRLISYLWADQPERLQRTRAVIDTLDARVDAGDAADWLEPQLKGAAPDHLTLVYHTIAWQYFPRETQTRCRDAIKTAAQRGPIAHFSMEADQHLDRGALLTLTLWPEGRKLTFGRVDFHGRWVDWTAP